MKSRTIKPHLFARQSLWMFHNEITHLFCHFSRNWAWIYRRRLFGNSWLANMKRRWTLCVNFSSHSITEKLAQIQRDPASRKLEHFNLFLNEFPEAHLGRDRKWVQTAKATSCVEQWRLSPIDSVMRDNSLPAIIASRICGQLSIAVPLKDAWTLFYLVEYNTLWQKWVLYVK